MRDAAGKPKIGKLLYACEKYEKLTRLTIPVIDQNYFLFVTIENDYNPADLYDKLNRNILSQYGNLDTHNNGNPETFICINDEKAYDFLNQKILSLHDRIRTVAICDEYGKVKARTIKEGKIPNLTSEESDKSIEVHSKIWKIRKKFRPKIGECKYAYAIYEKITRITVLLKEDFLLVTCGKGDSGKDNDCIYEEIIKGIEDAVNLSSV